MSVLVGGRYRLLERIGSGGMGVVWSGRDEVLRRAVAVKELRHGWGSSDRTVAEGRERGLREARAAAALDHPNIVGVYDVVEHDGRPWIVMELVSGRSLKDVVAEEGPLSVERAVGIGLQLLSALQAAHSAGITHRDVKPANVLISDAGDVRLTDFGLAVLPDAETLTETGVVLGTPGYLAPEQAKGLPPGPAADVFGFAATMYYAIEGVGPFHRDGYLPMLVAYARHEIRAPQRAGALAPALMQLLRADPEKRPTAEQGRELLLGGMVRRPGVSRRLVLTGAAATAAAAVGGSLWGVRHQRSVRSQRPTTTAPAPARAVGLGALAWQRDDLPMSMMVGSTFVSLHADGVLALDPQTGTKRWHGGPRGAYSIRGIGTSMVLVEGPKGYQVLAAETGAVRWRNPIAADNVAGTEGTFLLEPATSGAGSAMIGYDARTGRERWRVRVDDYLGYECFTSTAGVVCASARRDSVSWLYGIGLQDGKVRWRSRMSTAVDHSLRLSGHGDRAYVVILDKRRWTLVAVDTRTGESAWTVPLVTHPGAPLRGITEQDSQVTVEVQGLAAVGDIVVVSITEEQLTLQHAGLIALDVRTGAVRWRRPLLNPSVAAVSGERLFVGSHDSVLHELDPASGGTLWSTSTPGPASRLDVTPTMLTAIIGNGVTAYPLLPR
ncbi:protein kinase domain-containing protein [Actinoplanes sp. NPDC049118]|uniref:serine/threonine-protein kinase n=1 Tax=Actinoplanes sp. NPDC049118 TaxID=3155769 RepID=UPI0033F6DBB4